MRRIDTEYLLWPIHLAKVFLQSKKTSKVNRSDLRSQIMILGNGPSLTTDMSWVENQRSQYDIMCLNFFPSSQAYTKLRPQMLLVTDPYFKSTDSQMVLSFFSNLSRLTTWPITFFWPVVFPEPIGLSNHEFISLVTYNKPSFVGPPLISQRVYSSGMAIPSGKNVLVPAIHSAINAGYDRIILLGFDFSWVKDIEVSYTGTLLQRRTHFYCIPTDEKEDDLIEVHGINLRDQFRSVLKVLSSLDYTRRYAEARNVEIINASSHTMLDSFRRSSPKDLTFSQ